MKTETAIKLAGSKSALGRILGISRQAVCQWGEQIPELQRYKLKEKRPKWFAQVRREEERQTAEAA